MRHAPIRGGENRYAHPAQAVLLLMQAVLEDAVRSLLHHSGTPGAHAARRWREELAWFTSRDRSEPFAFENVCDALGIDACRLRRRVLAAGARVTDDGRLHSLAAPRGTMPYRCSLR